MRPARQQPDRVRLAGAADRRARTGGRRPSRCPRTPARSGGSRCGRRSCPRAGARGARRAGVGRRAARGPRPRPARLGRRPRRGRRRLGLVPALPRRRAARVPLARAAGRVPGRPARGARRARPRGRDAAGARPRRGGARSTRRSTGSRAPRRRRRPPPTSCTSPPRAGRRSRRSCTRRCTGRRWCSPSTASTCARPTSPRRAAATRRAAASPPRALARGLARAAYAGADVVAPGDRRQRLLGDGARDRPGEDPRALQRAAPAGASRRRRRGRGPWSSVGRIDPLKDIHTMLRVAAETLRLRPRRALPALRPGAPTARRPTAARAWRCTSGSACGDRFRFMGRDGDPDGVVRDADVVLMTSISEGLPMSILEAMGAGPARSSPTGVGGVPDVVTGCGVVAAPGDDHALAMAVVMLLRNPELAWRLGQRGHGRLGRIFNESACVDGYRELLQAVAAPVSGAAPAAIGLARMTAARAGAGRRRLARRGAARARARRTCSRPRSCSRPGPASRRSARSRRRARLMPEAPAAPQPSVGRLPAPSAQRPACCSRRGVRRHRHGDRVLGGAAGVEPGRRGGRARADRSRCRSRSRCSGRCAAATSNARGRRAARRSAPWAACVGAAALAAVPAAVARRSPARLAGLLTVTLDRRDDPASGAAGRRVYVRDHRARATRARWSPGWRAGRARRGRRGATAAAVAARAARAGGRAARPPPGRWARAVAAGAIGAGLGAHARARPDRELDRGRRSGARAAALDRRERSGPATTCATSSRRSRARCRVSR